jgi:ATP-dependent Clp protease adaptor protein ClpS
VDFDDSLQGMVMLVTAAWAVVVVATRMARTPHESLSPGSSIALAVAAHEAARRGHERIEPEHVLLAALFDRDLRLRVEAAGASAAGLRDELEAKLAALPSSAGVRGKSASVSPELAAALARASRTVNGRAIELFDLARALSPRLPLASSNDAPPLSGVSGPYRSARVGPFARVRIWNDDVSTMDAVVQILTRVFAKSHAEAMHLMLTTHHKGSAVIGEFARDEAESLAQRATELAREGGMPLWVAVEDADAATHNGPSRPSWLSRAWRKLAG